jgi:DNA-binding MarR family transcriptional regulator
LEKKLDAREYGILLNATLIELRSIEGAEELPGQAMHCFLTVIREPGITQKDLMSRTGMSQASVSRNVAALSKWHRLNKPGMDWVVSREDPVERRRKIVEPTDKGREVFDRLLRAANNALMKYRRSKEG